MPQKELFIRSSILTNKEKTSEGVLYSGKIESESIPGVFAFFMLEISSQWMSSAKVKHAVISSIEENFKNATVIDETFFEQLLQQVNESLDKLVKKGVKEWLGNLNAIIGIIQSNSIFISQTGKISGYIFRKSKISTILEGSKLGTIPHPIKTFCDVTSGQLANNDCLVFGNSELYNHISLDRIRKLVEQFPPQMAIGELFKNFRKNKITNVNVIAMEAKDRESIENEPVIPGLPEIYFLDEKVESQVKKLLRALEPIGQSGLKYLKLSAKEISKHSKVLYAKSKTKWEKELSPASAELIKKSNQTISKAFGTTSEKLSPQLVKLQNNLKSKKPKFKTSNYSKKHFLTISANVFNFLSPRIKLLLKKENRKYLYGCLIIIFFGMGYLKVRDNNIHRTERKTQMELIDSYNEASDLYNQTKEDIALGKVTGTEKLEECLALSKKAEESSATKEKALKLSKEIQESIDQLSNTKRMTDSAPIFKLNENISKIVLAGNDIYGIGSEGKIYTGNVKDNQTKLVSSIGEETGEATSLAFLESENKILVSTNKNKLLAFNASSRVVEELKTDNADNIWEDAKSLLTYSTNIYILNSDSGEVWKHTKVSENYSKGSAYLDTRNHSIRGATDFAIDGNVYVLLNTGEISKFTRGAYQSFSLTGQPKKIEAPLHLFTDEYTNFIFILDQKTNNILKFNKGGEYVSQYTLDSKKIDDFVVNGKTQKLWALSQGQIFEIDL